MWNAASLQCCSAASDREGEEGGRQGTISLLRLPQFLFNCLLIYLIMAATRTSGQAASVLSLKQFAALKLLLLDNPPSLQDLSPSGAAKVQSSPIFFCIPIKKQQDVTVDCSHLAPRQQRQEAKNIKDLQGDRVWTIISRWIESSDLNKCLHGTCHCPLDQH